MPLQLSGQISLSNIAGEKSVSLSNVSLVTLSTTSINTDSCNPTNPNNGAPHSIGEFYGYDHNCATQLLYEHYLYGPYGDYNAACFDAGRSTEQLVLYSDCQSLQDGCRMFYDNVGGSPFFENVWFYQGDGPIAWLIEEGAISLGAICEGGFGEPGFEDNPDPGGGGGRGGEIIRE
jgi:hypothetical protein